MVKPIGLHVHSGRANGQVEDYIRSVKPSVMKWLADGVEPRLVDLAKVYGALTILRVYEPNQALGNPQEKDFLALVESAIQRYPQFDAHEGYNEAFQRLPEVRRRAEFDIALMELCERHGKRAVIGSFSVGQPQWPQTGQPDDWAGYLPALQRASAKGHYVGLHEYGAPAMQWGVGANQAANLVNGQWINIDPVTRPGVQGWFVLRYRRVLAHWRELGLDPLPRIVITESGIDDIQPRPNVGTRRGYKTYRDTPWWRHPILGDYADQLGWVCDRWAEDPEVVGGVDFGFADISGDWDDFDLSTDAETLARVKGVMRDLEEPVPVDPSPPVTPGQPAPINQAALKARYRPRIIGAGETLWQIAGSQWRDVLIARPMGDPGSIPAGTILMVPESED
ncbi:MAG: hypothetical protein H6648_00185 [Caldilineae bacterium]|nr:hypothetical protein [Caldilineae bacterium]